MKIKIKLVQLGVLTLGLLLLSVAARAQVLGTTNLLKGPGGGNDSVVLQTTGSWTAHANATWLHLNPAYQSGTGNTNVWFNFDVNIGPTRTGTLTIAGLTLTITQPARAM